MAQFGITPSNMTGIDLDTILAAASVGGDSFTNDGTVNLIVRNSGGVSRTVTFKADSHACSMGLTSAVHNQDVTIPAGKTVILGIFDTSRFNDSAGLVQMTYDSEADLSLAVTHYA
jgi:hypothetical protein